MSKSYYIGSTLMIISSVYIIIQLFRYGFISRYWKRPGLWFKFHLIPGIIITALIPYFTWYFVYMKVAPALPIISIALCAIFINITGIRLIPLLPSKDYILQRNFFTSALSNLATILIILSLYIGTKGYYLSQYLLTILICTSIFMLLLTIYLSLLEIIQFTHPLKYNLEISDEIHGLKKQYISHLLKLFIIKKQQSSGGHGQMSKFVALMAVSLPMTIVSTVQLITSYRLLVIPFSEITKIDGMYNNTIMLIMSSYTLSICFVPWGLFEATLMLRGRIKGFEKKISTLFSTLIPTAGMVLIGMEWLNSSDLLDYLKTFALLTPSKH